jgi:hypothetical protein
MVGAVSGQHDHRHQWPVLGSELGAMTPNRLRHFALGGFGLLGRFAAGLPTPDCSHDRLGEARRLQRKANRASIGEAAHPLPLASELAFEFDDLRLQVGSTRDGAKGACRSAGIDQALQPDGGYRRLHEVPMELLFGDGSESDRGRIGRLPPIEEDPKVLPLSGLHAGLEPSGRLRYVLDEHPRVENHLQTVGPHREQEVEVLAGRQFVALVEAAQGSGHVGVHQVDDAAGQMAERLEHHPFGPRFGTHRRRVAGGCDGRQHDSGIRVLGDGLQQRRIPPTGEHGVVVDERDNRGGCNLQTRVHAVGEAGVRTEEHGDIGVVGSPLRRLRLRSVVDDHHLDRAGGTLPNRANARLCQRQLIPGEDDEGDARFHGLRV